jgi:hypothetical protein
VLVIALVASAAVVHAQPKPDPSNPDIVVAYKLEVEQGTGAFRAGMYNDARVSFARAYSLYPEPVLLFNIASCYRRAGDAAAAIAAYRRFLDAAPAEDHRITLATQTIASLEQELAAAAQDDDIEVQISDGSDDPEDDGAPILRLSEDAALPATTTVPPFAAATSPSGASPRRSSLPKYGLGIASAGALVLLGAVVDGYRAHAIAGELDALPRDHQWNHEDAGQYRAGERAALRARLLAVSGVVLTGTGVTLYVIGKRRDAGEPRIEGVVSPGGGQVVVRGRF